MLLEPSYRKKWMKLLAEPIEALRQIEKKLYSYGHLIWKIIWNRRNFFHLFLLVGDQLLYNIVVVFVIHWHESAMDLHVFPIPIPPPTSLSTRSLWVFPVHQPRAHVSCFWAYTEETRSERDTCTPVLIAALFTIARTWKQPRCPSADEWIRKLGYIHTMDHYSAVIIIAFTMLCNKSVCSARCAVHCFHVALCTGRWTV